PPSAIEPPRRDRAHCSGSWNIANSRLPYRDMDSVRPFAGIQVVEFGQFIAVPFCAQLLSEGGAHVVKIESVEGDPVRQLAPLAPGETRHFLSRNRGKHSLPLDLRHPSAARA